MLQSDVDLIQFHLYSTNIVLQLCTADLFSSNVPTGEFVGFAAGNLCQDALERHGASEQFGVVVNRVWRGTFGGGIASVRIDYRGLDLR